jgi:hypothetical protein
MDKLGYRKNGVSKVHSPTGEGRWMDRPVKT